MIEITLPELGEDIRQATLACWHVSVGDRLQAGQEICEVVTDKATFNVEAPADGILMSIQVVEGEDVAVGGVLGTIA